MFQTAAAGDFHAGDSDASDLIFPKDCSELFCVINRIQLWTTYEGDVSLNKILMEIRIGVGGTVGGDQEVGLFIVRSLDRQKLDLYRPLAKLTGISDGRRTGGGGESLCRSSRKICYRDRSSLPYKS